MAHAVRRGQLELHAYSLLTTHVHLLVRSPGESLSEAMQRIEQRFVLRFNRLRERDGPLFRARFTSRRVRTVSRVTLHETSLVSGLSQWSVCRYAALHRDLLARDQGYRQAACEAARTAAGRSVVNTSRPGLDVFRSLP